MKRLMLLALLPFFSMINASAAQPAVMIQSESVTIHVKADGSVEKNVSVTMKLNTFPALRAVGEWFYSYNPGLEEVEIIKSITTHKDGKQFAVPENAILDQTPASVENAPDFSNIREKMVSHNGLEPGCTVEFQYKITDLSPHRCGVLEPMGSPWPIHKKTVTIQLDRKAKVLVNGSIARKAAGVYEVKNTVSGRPAPGFSSSLDMPFLYIEIDNPVSRVKEMMSQEKVLEPVVLETLKVNRNSTPLEVETALNHLLNQRMATVYLEPELTSWTSRGFSQIVQSGYATPLEKIILAHAVLNQYNIPHTASLKGEKIGDVPIAIDIDFQLNTGLCHISPVHGGQSGFLLWGENTPKKTGTTVFINANLKEQEDSTFTGTITARKNSNDAAFSLATMNPVKNATVSGETILLKTGDNLAKKGELKLKLKNGQIQINPVLAQIFHLSDLEHAVLTATSIRMPEPRTGVLHISIEFRKEPTLALPEKMETANRIGSAGSVWQLQGKMLTIEQKFQVSPFRAKTTEFKEINALLTPILTQSASFAFVE